MRYCSARCIVEIARLDGMLSEVLKEVVVPISDLLQSGVTSVASKCGLAELTFLLSELNLEVISNNNILCFFKFLSFLRDCTFALSYIGMYLGTWRSSNISSYFFTSDVG